MDNRIEEIRRLKAGGKTYQEISKIYGVSRQRIQQLITNSGPVKTGPCNRCGEVGILHRHHTDYINNVTEDICVSCHTKAHVDGSPKSVHRPAIEQRLKNGETTKDIASDLGVSVKLVYKISRQKQLPLAGALLRERVAKMLRDGDRPKQIMEETGATYDIVLLAKKKLGMPNFSTHPEG